MMGPHKFQPTPHFPYRCDICKHERGLSPELCEQKQKQTRIRSIKMPKFIHDCDTCQFLGRYQKHDLYYCPKCAEGTVIARYGNHGPDYRSMPISMLTFTAMIGNSILLEALRRQIKVWRQKDA
jgi:hypothetical protein